MKKVDVSDFSYRSYAKVPNMRLERNINTVEELKGYLDDVYVLEDYMGSQLEFVSLYNHLFTVFVNCYPIRELRNYVVRFKLYRDDRMEHGLPFKRFMLNLPIWGSLQLMWGVVRIDDEFIMSQYDNAIFNDIMENANYLMSSYDVPIMIRSCIMADTYYRYTQLAYTLADVLNITLSLDDYIRAYAYEDEMKELTDVPIPHDYQPTEVKAEIVKRSKRLKEIYSRINNNGIGIIINSKTKINERQFQEMNISFGQIPDVYGTFIPKIIKNNGFNRGLTTPGDYYLEETVARYAAIINNDDMGEIGYFFRNVSIICGTVKLSEKIHDCRTNHYLKYVVDDLRFIEGKYYKLTLDDPELKVVHREDVELIGKTIYLRSAIYCACGDEICHVCYGRDFEYIEDLPGMGIYNSQIITNPVYQGILSVKHAIDGNIQTISTNTDFNEVFKISENSVELLDDIDSSEYMLLIEKTLVDEMDYRSENFGLVSEPYIYVTDGKKIMKCEIENIQDITYNTAILHMLKASKKYPDYYACPLSVLDEDGVITITMMNYGVSDVLKDFKRLIKYDSSSYTIERFLTEIIAIVRKAKIKCKLVQLEVLMNRLVRDPNDLTKRPNYTNDVVDEVICSISKALLNTKGVPVRLSFEQIKRQVLSYSLYDVYGDAYVQPLFEQYLYTEKDE